MPSLTSLNLEKDLFNGNLTSKEIEGYERFEKLQKIELTFLEETSTFNLIQDQLALYPPRISGAQDNAIWNTGWSEIFENICNNGLSLETLIPQYFHNKDVMRLSNRYVKLNSKESLGEIDIFIKTMIFKKYLNKANKIIEMGCGTGLNLFLLSKLFPRCQLVGTDWAPSSQRILDLFRNSGIDVESVNLDLRNPERFLFNEDDVILTVQVLEELGRDYQNFFNLMLQNKPRFILHIEPIFEHYSDTPFDKIAKFYHEKRNYLKGYCTMLLEESKKGTIKIEENYKIQAGTLHHDAYSVIKWSIL